MTDEPRLLWVGAEAVLVELGSRERAAAAYRVIREEADRDPSAVRDVVPAATTVLVDGVRDLDRWARLLTAASVDAAVRVAAGGAESVTIGVRYDGADLEAVAREWACAPSEVVERHAAAEFVVAFCGFAPGFAYCTSDPPLPAVSRRAEPRARVPEGAVALAAGYCGVYPRSMPGGWQLIGTTDAQLFDPHRSAPALLAPGTRVRFEVMS
jgi:KipI family sensor histidine kinase inhibitor